MPEIDPRIREIHDEMLEKFGPSQAYDDTLLTPAEVAVMFRVSPKTVTRWAREGKLSCVRTPGGHRRYRESEVRALLRAAGRQAS